MMPVKLINGNQRILLNPSGKGIRLPEGDLVLIVKKNFSSANHVPCFSPDEISFIHAQVTGGKSLVEINQYKRTIYLIVSDNVLGKKTSGKPFFERSEALRRAGDSVGKDLNRQKKQSVSVVDLTSEKNNLFCVAEGMALGNYQFLKYFKDAEKRKNTLASVFLYGRTMSAADTGRLQTIVNATCLARTLVNEPVSFLNAARFSQEVVKLGKESGFKVTVFGKKKIEALKMGGVLGVNKGSIDPPAFNILEWNPANAKNRKPYVLVGKGIVFDTGGLSLKSTKGSMDEMKSDMAGGAAVACTMYALARCKTPVHVIGLIPVTDNRPGGNAYAPGDVITLFDGTSVEVVNTDAEGRLILADALAYARQFNPELVIDLATLTTSCVRAFGINVAGMMGTAGEKTKKLLAGSGLKVFERLAEFPFWDDYALMMKSDVADLKNLSGSPDAGAITAGKFLEEFTKNKDGEPFYPWLHLDICGPAFIPSAESYRGKGGTGTGVRLLFDFFNHL